VYVPVALLAQYGSSNAGKLHPRETVICPFRGEDSARDREEEIRPTDCGLAKLSSVRLAGRPEVNSRARVEAQKVYVT